MKKKLIIILILLISTLNAQNPSDLDNSFDIGAGFDNLAGGGIFALHALENGKILAGGYFNEFNGQEEHFLIRLNEDGSKDSSFHSFSDLEDVNYPLGLIVQPDGKILVWGMFYITGVQNHRNIIRLNPDGSIDEGFHLDNSLFPLVVRQMKILPNGQFLIAGEFYVNNESKKVIKINPDGSNDDAFEFEEGYPTFSNNYKIDVQSDGKILAAHISSDPNVHTGLFRVNSNGSLDHTFQTLPYVMINFKVLPDDTILILAEEQTLEEFITYGSILLRLHRDGDGDNTFLPVRFNKWYFPSDLMVQPDGKIIVSAPFEQVNGEISPNLVRINQNGTLDETFYVGETGIGGMVRSMTIQADHKILLGGNIFTYKSLPVSWNLIRLLGDSVLDTHEINAANFKIYPNPVKETLYFSEKTSEIKIYDLSGKLIKTYTKQTDSLNLTELPKGNYIITGTTQSGEKFSSKFVKQ